MIKIWDERRSINCGISRPFRRHSRNKVIPYPPHHSFIFSSVSRKKRELCSLNFRCIHDTFISRLSTHILCIRSVRALRSSVRIHHSRLPNRISPNGHVVKYYSQRVSRATRCIFSLNGIETEQLLSLCNEEKINYHSAGKQRCLIVSQNRVDSLKNDLFNKKLLLRSA